MVSAGVTAAAVSLFVMVIAGFVGIIYKSVFEQCLHTPVTAALCSGIKADACFCEGLPCTATDTSANKSVYSHKTKEACQSTVSAAHGAYIFN